LLYFVAVRRPRITTRRVVAGAQLCALEEADGWRYQLAATNTPGRQLDFLEAPPPLEPEINNGGEDHQ
jgi:hypothetical protein